MHPWAVGINLFHYINKRHVLGHISKGKALRNQRNHIHTKTVYPFGQPKINNSVNFLPHFGIFPVQIGLLLGVEVEKIFFGSLVPLPHAPIKNRLPIVGQLVWVIPPPDVIIVIGVVFAFLGLLKPLVLVGRVVDDQIHD